MLVDYIIQILFLSIGVIVNEKYQKYELILRIFLFTVDIITITSALNGFLISQTFTFKCGTFGVLIAEITFFIHRIIGCLKRNRLRRLIHDFQNIPSYIDVNKIEINMRKDWKKFLIPCVKIIATNLILMSMVPYVTIMLSDNVDYNDPALYILPYLYHFWNINSLADFICLVLLQNMAVGSITALYYSFIVVANFILSNIKAKVIELNTQLNKLTDEFSDKNIKSTETEEGQLLYKKYIIIIKYQRYLQRYTKDFADYINFILSYYVIHFICVTLSYIYLFMETYNSGLSFAQNMFGILTLIYGFYVWCYLCESIQHMNEDILESLYLTQWYNLPIKIRKLTVTTMMHTQLATNVKAFNIYTINNRFFFYSLRIIYSLINLLLFRKKRMS